MIFYSLIFSTYVEVILILLITVIFQLNFLHVCGGDPEETIQNRKEWLFSPRMWRWSWVKDKAELLKKIFSTYVEVILQYPSFGCHWNDFLHVCGGDPIFIVHNYFSNSFSPRMWRWSSNSSVVWFFSSYFLHVCGGDPKARLPQSGRSKFSPRMWRWSSNTSSAVKGFLIFSTYVEVILNFKNAVISTFYFLHVCGGDPRKNNRYWWIC